MNEGNQQRLKGNKIPEVHGNAEGIETKEGKRCEPECKAVWGALPREGQHTPGTCQVHVDIWSAEASQGTGERAAAVKMCGYEGNNPNFIREFREAKTDLDSAEEMAIGRFTDG